MRARPFQFFIRSAIAMFVFVCSIEAQHWPLFLMKPGTELEWWQVKWLAKTGDLVGFPVMVATFALGELRLPQTIRSIAYPLCAILWAACVYLLLGFLFRTQNRPDPK
ncbi:MAG TPA: hypothetical protein VL357_07580 [Rariglobus sp.]|jgi:hypothetical protein|nr:hypothetical protein [Rariglobus sp.]